tara:strand:+ start:5730 stop:7247 length:1518 start_codon:yes stop_codon:yes gene_type:complete
MKKKVILMILDGWGNSSDPDVSAINFAKTPFIDNLYSNYANASLRTDGLNVGLPEGQMGNSEVGHMNLGAGRIVYQDLVKINLSIKNKTISGNPVLKNAISYAKLNEKSIHLVGLVSNGGVHSHIDHLYGLIDVLEENNIKNGFIHAFTDGRDVDPKSGLEFISSLKEKIKNTNIRIATICGRYYSMDRDKRWERIKLAYDALVSGIGLKSKNLLSTIKESYSKGITDEFLKPIIFTDEHDKPLTKIKDGDVVLFFNFRTDRGRQLTQALSQCNFPDQNMYSIKLHYVTMTNYDQTFNNVGVIFDKENLNKTLGEVLENHNKSQIRIAETEKYPHVTYFFSGGREKPFEGEKRILRNSPEVATYNLKPEMSAYEISKALIPELKSKSADFVCLNFANGDMVGHTGDMKAAIKACEVVDECVKEVVNCAINNDYAILLISDHGNCETMINNDGSPNTAHTTNPVPLILIDKDFRKIKNGILGDIAPTILKLMGIDKPKEMTQNSLI